MAGESRHGTPTTKKLPISHHLIGLKALTPKGFPNYEYDCMELNRVKPIRCTIGVERVKVCAKRESRLSKAIICSAML